ncbi:UDP-glucuronosyl/UDP-glucosyltransferase [Artemisia annua]|uniref:UDP-glucuronosyl/UDP-glucosyltransferase n=1 Tax=Artemisia annua TaxID=35608 RepID=A0A2U1NBI6_ARTAN|nr:UDP-glucuronosyl/UDP-glucosyltransferase [Artemisia annua]
MSDGGTVTRGEHRVKLGPDKDRFSPKPRTRGPDRMCLVVYKQSEVELSSIQSLMAENGNACDRLQEPIADFLKTSSPDWIICDFHTHWLGPVAAEHGVLMAYFSVYPAVFLGFFGSPEVLMHGCDGRRTP